MSSSSATGEGITKQQTDYVWQDREIRFDSKPPLLACRRGEKIIDSINSVEDTKGNNGERGSLIVTNLRIIWVAHNSSKINLSIGLSTVVSANIKQAKSKLRGHTQALCVLAKFQTRFEFVFTSLVKNSPRLFTTVQAVLRAYETSKLYRDLKLRGSIVKDNELILLPQEQVFNRIPGVWNLSSEQGNLGCFFLTNVRIVWHANLAANFNVSLPYMQVKSLRVRDSKFGRALVLETFAKSGGYILGFRVDPQDRIGEVYQELCSLYQVYSSSPNFGVDFSLEQEAPPLEKLLAPQVTEDTVVVDEAEDTQAIAAFYSANMALDDESRFEHIGYDAKLGLAVEQLVPGVTLEQLWRVV
jgi:Bardet-Biedl syndrome 5 protein|eukprot:gene5748-4115_t